jgi:hypothetical protein
VVAAVWRREEIFAGPYLDLAPDLTLELQDGGLLSILASETAVTPRPQPTGTHRPEGIFVAGGPAVRNGIVSKELSILDVAPLLLYGLGLPTPISMEGHLPRHLLMSEALKDHPERYDWAVNGVYDPAPLVEPSWPVLNEEEEIEILRRLQALGYVE